MRTLHHQRGETLIGLLISLGLSSVILAGTIATYFNCSRAMSDNQIKADAQEEARNLADLVFFDMRMSGAGVPFYQPNFQIGAAALGSVPLPLLTSATNTSVVMRLNEKGFTSVLTASFDPASTTTISLNQTTGLTVGDTIYVSDYSAGGSNGFRGTVQSISLSSVVLSGSYTASAGAIFPSGSVLEPVRLVTITSDVAGISRNAELGPLLLSDNSSISFIYRDEAGVALPLPLTDAVIRNQLTSISFTVLKRSTRILRSGAFYNASAARTVALRNLILARH